jgi:uncharacterized protein YjbI with pentapeptide repeats
MNDEIAGNVQDSSHVAIGKGIQTAHTGDIAGSLVQVQTNVTLSGKPRGKHYSRDEQYAIVLYWNGITFLHWFDLAGRDLARKYLSGAYLYHANLSDADLTRANLSWADLMGANLSGANLSGANMLRASLIGANLHRANLTGANLRLASLEWADLREANLSETKMWLTRYNADTKWPEGFIPPPYAIKRDL